MSIYETTGIILKKVDYLDKHKIILFFTKNLSKISAIGLFAKKSIKRKLNLLDYGNFLKISILRKKNYPLYIVQHVDIIDRLIPYEAGIEYIAFFQLCSEIINLVIYDQEDSSELFDFFISFLKKVKDNESSFFDKLGFFKIMILEKIGLGLNNKRCLICGCNGEFFNYSIEKCGFVCKKCSKKVLKINPGTIKSFEYINTGKTNIRLSKEILNDINKIFYVNLYHLRNIENVKKVAKFENYLKWILNK